MVLLAVILGGSVSSQSLRIPALWISPSFALATLQRRRGEMKQTLEGHPKKLIG